MKALKNLFDFYINSSIHLSLAIVSLTAVTYLNFGIPVDYKLLLFIFLSSVTGYNFIKYAGIAKFYHISLPKDLRFIQMFSLVIFLALLISVFFQPFEVIVFALIMAVFTGLYALPVFYNRTNLRGIPGLKIYITAFVVSGVTVLMPLVPHEDLLQRDILLDFVQRFLIVITLVLPFEIRDLKYDMADLGTIPQKIGVSGAKRAGFSLMGFFLVLEFFKKDFQISYFLSLIVLTLMSFLFLKNSSILQKKYYASFWVEAVPVFWFLAFKIFINLLR